MKMITKLTGKQETFCKEYTLNNGQGTEAYKKAYSTSKMKPETINNNAYMILQKREIKARIEELKKPLQEKFNYSMEQSFEMFKTIQALSFEKGELNNSIKCEELKGKLLGLYTDKLKLEGEVDINNHIDIKFIE
jgi:hypothetical protein